jgi:hypothetical protein
MFLAELKNYLAIYQLQGIQEEFLNRKSPPTPMQVIEYLYTCYELEGFVNSCHELNQLNDEKISQLNLFLQKRAQRIKDSKSDYAYDPKNPANQMCYQIAKSLQSSQTQAVQLLLTQSADAKTVKNVRMALDGIDLTPRTRTRQDDVEKPKPYFPIDIEDDVFTKIAADESSHHLFLKVNLFSTLADLSEVKNKILLIHLLLNLGDEGVAYLREQITNVSSLQSTLTYLNEEQRIKFIISTGILNKLMAARKQRHKAMSADEFLQVISLFHDKNAVLNLISPQFLHLYSEVDYVAEYLGDDLYFDRSDLEYEDSSEDEQEKAAETAMAVVVEVRKNPLIDLTEESPEPPSKKQRVGDFFENKALPSFASATPTLFHHKKIERETSSHKYSFTESYKTATTCRDKLRPLEAFYYIMKAYDSLARPEIDEGQRRECIQQLKGISQAILTILFDKDKWADCYRHYSKEVPPKQLSEWAEVAQRMVGKLLGNVITSAQRAEFQFVVDKLQSYSPYYPTI